MYAGVIGISSDEKYIVNVPVELPSENVFEEAELLPSEDEDRFNACK